MSDYVKERAGFFEALLTDFYEAGHPWVDVKRVKRDRDDGELVTEMHFEVVDPATKLPILVDGRRVVYIANEGLMFHTMANLAREVSRTSPVQWELDFSYRMCLAYHDNSLEDLHENDVSYFIQACTWGEIRYA